MGATGFCSLKTFPIGPGTLICYHCKFQIRMTGTLSSHHEIISLSLQGSEYFSSHSGGIVVFKLSLAYLRISPYYVQ